MKMIPTEVIAKAFTKSLETYPTEAVVQKQMAAKLFGLVSQKQTEFYRALEVGCGSGFLSQYFLQQYRSCQWFFNDLFQHPMLQLLQQKAAIPPIFLKGNAESLTFPKSLDLIVSSSTVQWFQNIPIFLEKCTQQLNQKGQIALATFGQENLTEIKQLSAEGLPYFSSTEWQSLLQQHFTHIKIIEERKCLYFPSALAILKHLKATGVNAGSRNCRTHSQLHNFLSRYEKRFQTPRGISLTYHPLYITATKK